MNSTTEIELFWFGIDIAEEKSLNLSVLAKFTYETFPEILADVPMRNSIVSE